MEYLTKIIKQAEKQAGGVQALEDALGMARNTLSMVKAKTRSLPVDACVKLKDMTGADLEKLLAQSEAITTTRPDKLAFWLKKSKKRL